MNSGITEIQNTTATNDRISGDLVFRFADVDSSEFFRYRNAIRNLVGFGNLGLSQTVINERALVTENHLEKDPNTFRVAQTPPMPQGSAGTGIVLPAAHLPGQPKHPRSIPYTPSEPETKKTKLPKIRPVMRAFLLTLVGKEQNDIISWYRERFKQSKISNQGILDMYAAVHNI
jgi:hypothetical protein